MQPAFTRVFTPPSTFSTGCESAKALPYTSTRYQPAQYCKGKGRPGRLLHEAEGPQGGQQRPTMHAGSSAAKLLRPPQGTWEKERKGETK